MENGDGRACAEASGAHCTETFASVLARHGISLVRERARALQVSVGYLCDRGCRHCHLSAGPGRREVMSRETMEAVVAFARRERFEVVDITGGAPERAPDLCRLIEGASEAAPRVMLRSDLGSPGTGPLLDLCVARRVVLVASFPSTDPARIDAQRGPGEAERLVSALRRLNAAGYGMEGSGLELDLVVNPPGACLPPPQAQVEREFRRELSRKWGISFGSLYTFANVPLGRFREGLHASGDHGRYMKALADAFNPCAAAGLMCRTQLSVSWEGHLHDCDFNLAAGRPLGGRAIHVAQAGREFAPGAPIAVGDYCFACTAGSGFT